MTDRIQELTRSIDEHEAHIHSLENIVKGERMELAHLACPFKVGDMMVNTSGRRAIIEEIKAGRGNNKFQLAGTMINKDGNPAKGRYSSRQRADFEFFNWKRETDGKEYKPYE
ncbi:MAG: hypothetical protein WC329_01725 [Candidatus Omnitrophota bacterium]|jgi:hypothetical protein